MPIRVTCRCGQMFEARDDLAGKTLACPMCRSPLVIPRAEEVVLLAAIVEDDGFGGLFGGGNMLDDDLLNDTFGGSSRGEGGGFAAADPDQVCSRCGEPLQRRQVTCYRCGQVARPDLAGSLKQLAAGETGIVDIVVASINCPHQTVSVSVNFVPVYQEDLDIGSDAIVLTQWGAFRTEGYLHDKLLIGRRYRVTAQMPPNPNCVGRIYAIHEEIPFERE